MEFLNSIYPNIVMMFSPVQLLAWVAAVIYIISYQKKSADQTIGLWVPADMLMAAHFYFMNVPLMMMIAIGGTLRSAIAVKCPKKILVIYLIAYLTFITACLYFIGDEFKDYMAVIGTFCFSFSTLMKHHFLWHRAFAFCHQVCWFIAFILLGSYGRCRTDYLHVPIQPNRRWPLSIR